MWWNNLPLTLFFISFVTTYFVSFVSAFPLFFCGRIISDFPYIIYFSLCLPSFSPHQCLLWRAHRNAQRLWQLELFPSLSRWTGIWLSQLNRLSFPPTAPCHAENVHNQRARKGLEAENKDPVVQMCWEMWGNTYNYETYCALTGSKLQAEIILITFQAHFLGYFSWWYSDTT